jgi:hypothetical protein
MYPLGSAYPYPYPRDKIIPVKKNHTRAGMKLYPYLYLFVGMKLYPYTYPYG